MSASHVPYSLQNGQDTHYQATSPYPSETESVASHAPNGTGVAEHTNSQEGDYGMAGPSSVSNGYTKCVFAFVHVLPFHLGV